MTVHEGLADETPDGVDVGSLLRRSFAAACITVLAGLGVWGAWRERHEFPIALLALGVTLGPAVAYAFGYFLCLPDVLGTSTKRDMRTPWQRWSDYARLSATFAIVSTWTGWAVYNPTSQGGIFMRSVSWEETLAEVPIFTSLLLGAIVASEDYLVQSMSRGEARDRKGWRAKARWVVHSWGDAVIRVLTPSLSLALGGILVLISLRPWVPQLFSRRFEWITAEYTDLGWLPARLLREGARGMCVLAIGISLLGLIAVLAGKRGETIRRSHFLSVVSAILALFFVCDFTFGWARLSRLVPPGLVFGVSVVVWLLPVGLWLWRGRGGGEHWNRTRLAILILYLPIFFFTVSFLIPTIQIVPYYVIELIGLLFLWWGFMQSGWQGLERN